MDTAQHLQKLKTCIVHAYIIGHVQHMQKLTTCIVHAYILDIVQHMHNLMMAMCVELSHEQNND